MDKVFRYEITIYDTKFTVIKKQENIVLEDREYISEYVNAQRFYRLLRLIINDSSIIVVMKGRNGSKKV